MAKRATVASPSHRAAEAVALLKQLSSKQDYGNLKRFGIVHSQTGGLRAAGEPGAARQDIA